MVTPGRLELPAYGLGNRRSILLSYGVTPGSFCRIFLHFARSPKYSGLIFKDFAAAGDFIFHQPFLPQGPYPVETHENSAPSVNRSPQTSAAKMTRQARAHADATETETTLQLDRQQAPVSANGRHRS